MHTGIQLAASAIQSADVIFIAAGAGMGVDSGLPDFRGNEGFWNAYPLLREEGLSFIDLANPQWFDTDPARAWGFYGHRYHLYKRTLPHAGFTILQTWCAAKKAPSFVFTSNVDGHFQKAGFDEQAIYECHGSINHLQCQSGHRDDIWPAGDLSITIDEERLIALGALPCCPETRQIARPNILMFNDGDWIPHRSDAQHDRLEQWFGHYHRAEIVTIELGAGTAIPTVRHASDSIPGTTIRINPREPSGNDQTISLAMGALEALQAIDKALSLL